MKKLILSLSLFIAFSCSTKEDVPNPNFSKIDISQSVVQAEQSEVEDLINSKNFKDLMDNHDKFLLKRKNKKNLKFNNESNKKDFESKLVKAKSKEDLISAFSLVDDNPQEIYDYMEYSLYKLQLLSSDLRNMGKSESQISEILINAIKENGRRKISEFNAKISKKAKYDCSYICSMQFSIAEQNTNDAFFWGGVLVVSEREHRELQ